MTDVPITAKRYAIFFVRRFSVRKRIMEKMANSPRAMPICISAFFRRMQIKNIMVPIRKNGNMFSFDFVNRE
jgi:hypothetical protein